MAPQSRPLQRSWRAGSSRESHTCPGAPQIRALTAPGNAEDGDAPSLEARGGGAARWDVHAAGEREGAVLCSRSLGTQFKKQRARSKLNSRKSILVGRAKYRSRLLGEGVGRLWWEVFSTNYREPIKNSLGRTEIVLVEGRDEIIVCRSFQLPCPAPGGKRLLSPCGE